MTNYKKLALGGVVGAGALVVAAPLVIAGAGFGAGGVVAGSMAAGIQSSIGTVAAGSWFAAFQSAGAAGLAGTTYAGLGATGGALGGAVARWFTRNPTTANAEDNNQETQTDDVEIIEEEFGEEEVESFLNSNEKVVDKAVQTGGL